MNRWWQQVKLDLMAQKKKVGMGAALLAVALLLWGRLLLSDPPRSAVAEPQTHVAKAPSATPTPDQRGEVRDAESEPVVVIDIVPGAKRNLFAVDPEHYPDAFPAPEQTKASTKSGDDPADQDEGWQATRRAVLAEASALTLQSTMLGARSRAMIDGVLLETGQSIRGFELIEVRARQVTLVKQSVEVTLEM